MQFFDKVMICFVALTFATGIYGEMRILVGAETMCRMMSILKTFHISRRRFKIG